jgi:uncharacterized short protein YbdD (DUF466 family)
MRDRRKDQQAESHRGGESSPAVRLRRLLRQLAGMPDYELHLKHLRQCHPEQRIPTEREYFEEYLRTRYHPGRSRCC